jgi:hypothetical protein
MANALYDKGRQAFLEGSIAYLTDTIKVALVTNGYTPNLSTHQFYSDLTPGSNVVGTPQTLGSKTSTNGVANAANVTYTAVTAGSTVTYLAIYKDTGSNSTSPLIALIDTATGLPVSTNGGDITVSWDTGANKILKL